jgi:hypothetical protein
LVNDRATVDDIDESPRHAVGMLCECDEPYGNDCGFSKTGRDVAANWDIASHKPGK